MGQQLNACLFVHITTYILLKLKHFVSCSEYIVLTYVELGENHHEKCSYSMMECTQINASMYFGCTMVLVVELGADELQNLKIKWNDDIFKK